MRRPSHNRPNEHGIDQTLWGQIHASSVLGGLQLERWFFPSDKATFACEHLEFSNSSLEVAFLQVSK